MRIAEIYASVQGEGVLTGTPSVFVRTSGCNLRCGFCDTPYTSWEPEGDDWSVDEVVEEALGLAPRHVVVTGGEPMVWGELVPLTEQLREAGCHVTVETAGTVLLPVACDLMSISPKLSNSVPDARRFPRWAERHERTRHRPAVIRELCRRYEYQLKFVIDRPEDVDEVLAWLEAFPEVDRRRVLLMPQGTDCQELAARAEWLERRCREVLLGYCPRRQIEWFGGGRRT